MSGDRRSRDRFLVVPGRDLLGPDRWDEVFPGPGPLVVEIGFGKDEFLLELAASRPEDRFLAVDFSRPRARSYLEKIRRRGLSNVRVLVDHAMNVLGLCLPDASVAEMFVLFPDPWPKERHAGHRLVRSWFAREAARVLRPGARLTLATDDEPYRDQILDVLEGSGAFENVSGPGASGPRPPGYDPTLFEQRWVRKGRDIYYMQFTRRYAEG